MSAGGYASQTSREVENAATDELAFVQVKSRAGQATLTDYVQRFYNRPHNSRMIFVVHTPEGSLDTPADLRIQVGMVPRSLRWW
jgi:hypothetical protein